MAELDREAKEVNARIVYWGIEGAGKTTSIRLIAERLRADHRGRLRTIPTGLDPTISYDLLPIELGAVAGMRTRIQIIGVPGAAELAPMRQQLLDQADGLVFVVDAQPRRIDENVACYQELCQALAAYGRSPSDVPVVVQYNKCDLSDPYTLDELHRKLDLHGVAAFECVATDGPSVLKPLTTVSKAAIRFLRDRPAGSRPPETAPLAEAPQPAPAPVDPPPGLAARSEVEPLEEEVADRAASIGMEAEPIADAGEALAPPEAARDAPVLRDGGAPDEIREDGPTDHEDASGIETTGEAPPPERADEARGAEAGSFGVVAVEPARMLDRSTLWIPLVLQDRRGQRMRLALTVSLDALDEEDEDG